jgi:hypothetical protein
VFIGEDFCWLWFIFYNALAITVVDLKMARRQGKSKCRGKNVNLIEDMLSKVDVVELAESRDSK